MAPVLARPRQGTEVLTMRSRLVVGNWKMHGSLDEIESLLSDILAAELPKPSAMEIGVCPTFLHIPAVRQRLSGSGLLLGAQDARPEAEGAFTGAVAAAMLTEFDVHFLIVGHSERRQVFGETDADVAEKFAAAQRFGLQPILCLGETREQREQDKTEEVVLGQLDAVLEAVGIGAFEHAVLAYEPVWAIGTGETATPEQAQEVHALLRAHLARQDSDIAGNLRILYGGSVKAANAAELFGQQDIDGGLVGGASLKPDEFIAICNTTE